MSALPGLQFALAGLLILFLCGAGAREAWREGFARKLSRREAAALGACFLLALLARLSATPFPADHSLASSQGHVIGNGHRWAAGYSVILHALYQFFPSGVATVAMFNVLVGALTTLAVFAFVDAYFEDRPAALSAAAVLAVQPISVRFAASDSAHVVLTFCLFAGCFCLARAARAGGRLLLLQGAGWLALAANVRFEGAAYALAGALILAGATTGRLDAKARASLLGAGAFYLLFLVYPVGQALLTLSGGHADTFSALGFLGYFFHSKHSPASIALVAVAGLVWAAATRRRETLAFLAAVVVVSLPTERAVFDNYDVGNRYVLPHLAAWSVFAGLGFSAALSAFPGRARRLPALGAAAVLVVILSAAAPHRGFLRRMWTFALEYDFIVAHLRGIPEACVLVQTDDPRDAESRSLRIGGPLSWEVGKRHEWRTAADVLAGPIPSCAIFYAGVACYTYEASRHPRADWDGAERPVCRRMRERFLFEPLASAAVPTIPYQEEAYTIRPVPIGFYRLRDRAPSSRARSSL